MTHSPKGPDQPNDSPQHAKSSDLGKERYPQPNIRSTSPPANLLANANRAIYDVGFWAGNPRLKIQ
jgi:hypothetical protein